MCSFISHMLNHFRCEPLKNVFCFVRNRLMLDDAMNSVYSGKRYLFQLACLCVVFFFFFFGSSMSVSVLLSSAVVSHMFFVGFFLFGQSKLKFTNSSCMLVFHWLKKRLENQQKTPIVWMCLLFA